MSTLEFAAVPAATRRDHVAGALREAILAGKIAPGTQLVESRLSSQFGVSRGLLREAVRELIEAGLLVNKAYAGTFVVDIDEQTMRELYEVRGMIERKAFERVWPRRDEGFGAELRARFDALAKAARSRVLSEQSAAEAHFHGLVYERCGNRLLLDIWRQLTQKIQFGLAICQVTPVPKPDFIENHRRFMELALGDDLPAMLAELDAHLESGLRTLQKGVLKR